MSGRISARPYVAGQAMRITHLSFAALLGVTVASCAASRDVPASDARNASCDVSYEALCGPQNEADDARAERHKHVNRAIEAEVVHRLAERLSFAPVTVEGWLAHVRAEPDGVALERLRGKVRAELVTSRTASLREAAVDELSRLRQRAREVVDREERVPSGARERLDAVQLAWVGRAGWQNGTLRPALRRACGDSLLVDDAWIAKDGRTIVLCPGFLLVSSGRAVQPDEAFRERLAFLLAHELGHVVAGVGGPGSEVESERAADTWGARIFAADLATTVDEAERARRLRRGFEPICAPVDDGVHGGGAARVERAIDEAGLRAPSCRSR